MKSSIAAMLAILPGIFWPAPGVAAQPIVVPDEYVVYLEVKALYDDGMASGNCGHVETIATLLKELQYSKEPIPPELAEEFRTGRAEVGVYVRHVRRVLNKRKAELCPIVPAPCQDDPQPAELSSIDQLYAIAAGSQYCSILLSAAQQMIAESDALVAPHTLELLISLQQDRPECFAAGQ